MGYIVKQPYRTKTYVLFATNQHIPGKGARQHRRYLGALDITTNTLILGKQVPEPTDEVLTALTRAGIQYTGRRQVAHLLSRAGVFPASAGDYSALSASPTALLRLRTVEQVGDVHMLLALADQIGLAATLHQVYGASVGRALLVLALHQVATHDPFYLAASWFDQLSATLWPPDIDGTSPGLSRLLNQVGADARLREQFFTAWIHRCGTPRAVICDTTSLSTYSRLLAEAEWGYNRDHEPLPQVNVALVVAREPGLPLLFRLLPGSLPDVATLQHTATVLHACGLSQFAFLLDKGFYSQANLHALLHAHLSFLLPVPFRVAQARALRQRYASSLATSPKRSVLVHDQLVRYAADAWTIPLEDGTTQQIAAHLYYDPARAGRDGPEFEQRVFLAEAEAQLQHFAHRGAAWRWLKEQPPAIAACLGVHETAERLTIAHKPHAIAHHLRDMGYTLLITDQDFGEGAAVLREYRRRDWVEKLIDMHKNELDQSRLRSGDSDTVQGRLLVSFAALALYATLERRLADSHLLAKWSVAEVLAELRKLKVAHLATGERLVMELTKKQRSIFEALQVQVPV